MAIVFLYSIEKSKFYSVAVYRIFIVRFWRIWMMRWWSIVVFNFNSIRCRQELKMNGFYTHRRILHTHTHTPKSKPNHAWFEMKWKWKIQSALEIFLSISIPFDHIFSLLFNEFSCVNFPFNHCRQPVSITFFRLMRCFFRGVYLLIRYLFNQHKPMTKKYRTFFIVGMHQRIEKPNQKKKLGNQIVCSFVRLLSVLMEFEVRNSLFLPELFDLFLGQVNFFSMFKNYFFLDSIRHLEDLILLLLFARQYHHHLAPTHWPMGHFLFTTIKVN